MSPRTAPVEGKIAINSIKIPEMLSSKGRVWKTHEYRIHHSGWFKSSYMKPMKVSFFFDPAQLRTGHDLLSMLAVAVFGFLNGYCVSLSLIVVIEIPDLSQEQRKTCDFVQAFQVFTLGSTVESHPKRGPKSLIERKDNQRTFRQQHRTPTSLAALGDTLILQFRCDFSLVLTCLEMAEVLTDSWKQHMGGSKNYSGRSPAGSARTKVTRCHFFFFFFFFFCFFIFFCFFFLLLMMMLMMLLLFQVKYFRPNTSKNTVRGMFMPLEEKHWFLRCFCSVKGENRPKTSLFTLFFSERVENTVFCDVFQQGALNVPRHGFLHFFTFSSQSKPAKNTGIYKVLTRQHAKIHDVLILSSCGSFFTLLLPPLIRTQEGVTSGQIAKLHLNSTFCLSQSLLQSCNTKNWGRLSGPQNVVNYVVLWTYHAFYLQKKVPPLPS